MHYIMLKVDTIKISTSQWIYWVSGLRPQCKHKAELVFLILFITGNIPSLLRRPYRGVPIQFLATWASQGIAGMSASGGFQNMSSASPYIPSSVSSCGQATNERNHPKASHYTLLGNRPKARIFSVVLDYTYLHNFFSPLEIIFIHYVVTSS